MASTFLNLGDMRNFVYDSLDTDSTDLPTSVLDRFIIDGSERVESFSDAYSFRQVDYSITTQAGVQAYDVRSDARVPGIVFPLRRIVDARGDNWSLSPDDHRTVRARYSANTSNTGKPTTLTLWADSIYLWPTPDAEYTLSLLGMRDPIDWVATNASPDMPNDLAELVAWWALSRAYAHDGDLGSSQFFRDEFFLELPKRAGRYTPGLTAQPIVLNGGSCRSSSDYALSDWLAPLVFDWE